MVVKFTLEQIRQNLPSSIFAVLQYLTRGNKSYLILSYLILSYIEHKFFMPYRVGVSL